MMCYAVDWLTISGIMDVDSYLPEDIALMLNSCGRSLEWHPSSRVWQYCCSVYKFRGREHKLFTLTWFPRTPVLPVGAVRLQLANSVLYGDWYAVLKPLLEKLKIRDAKVARIDLCCDFTADAAHEPILSFVSRFMRGEIVLPRYAKWHIYGDNAKDSTRMTGYCWGSRTSVVYSRLYNKVVEMDGAGNSKPYIHAMWLNNGWNGTDHVWRLEFECKGLRARQGSNVVDSSLDCWHPHNLLTRYWGLYSKYADFRVKDNDRTARCSRYELLTPPALFEPITAVTKETDRLLSVSSSLKRQIERYLARGCGDWQSINALEAAKAALTNYIDQ